MKFLILSHIDDLTAIQVYALLKNRHGLANVKLVSSEQLIYAPHWQHQLEKGATMTQLKLSDGTSLCSTQIGVVFNRLHYVSMPHFSNPEDRNYAVMEMHGLLLSWLASLPCEVINKPKPRGLGVHKRSQLEWLVLAAKAGLPVQNFQFTTNPRRFPNLRGQPYRQETKIDSWGNFSLKSILPQSVGVQPVFYLEQLLAERQKVLVTSKQIVGLLGSLYEKELKKLLALTECDLLQIEFAQVNASSTHEWKVTKVDVFPQLKTSAEIQAIVSLLETKL